MIYTTFDEISTMSKFIQIISPYVDEHLGRALDKSGNPLTAPAFLIRSQILPESQFPRLILGFGGSREVSGHTTNIHIEEYDDPENVGNKLYRRITEKHIRYVLQLTAYSGTYDEVLQGKHKSGEYILRFVRNLLMLESVRKQFREQMQSGVEQIITISPQFSLNNTVEENSATMTIPFTTIDTIVEEGIGVIETIEWDGELKVDETDPNPLLVTGSVTISDNP